jgi:hypothetical protein
MNTELTFTPELIRSRIFDLRGHRVLLDADLAAFYGVPTKVFNQAVRRNAARFPSDFRFQLSPEEFANLRSQIVTSSLDPASAASEAPDSPQHGGHRWRPWAFTEHGALMAATVLNSPRAVQMSLLVVRAFVALRRLVADHRAFADKLGELEARVGGHDEQLAAIIEAIRQLVVSPGPEHGRKIGFHPGNR